MLAHSGEAIESRRAFEKLSSYERDSVIEFLKTLQVLPPGTKDRIVDEKFQAREWPPKGLLTTTAPVAPGRTSGAASAKATAAGELARNPPRRKNP